jgi:hypothetical protein
MPEDTTRPAQAAIRTDLDGTVTQNLADHLPVAWGRGEDVQALGSGERRVWAAASVRRAQAQGCGADRPDFPIIVIKEAGLDGFWIHRVLQSEGSRATWSTPPRS